MTLPSAHSTSTLRTINLTSEPGSTPVLSPSPFGMSGGTHSTSTLRTINLTSEPGSTPVLSPSPFGMSGGTHSTATLRAVNLTSEPGSFGMSGVGGTTLRAINVAPQQFSSVQYVNGTVDGTALQGNVRYLVPVQRASDSYMVVNQTPQMLTPVYLQNLQSVQRVSVSSMEETDSSQNININGQASSVYSQPTSPMKSPEPPERSESRSSSVLEVNSHLQSEVKTEFEFEPVAKLDTRFFGELLAEVYRKNTDIHSCISEHVAKMRGRKILLDLDYKGEKEDIEHLIPKGVSELTKQQIRYLLQTRMTADKTMRMLLSTFSSLREDLLHLQEDLRRLETEKEQLERDLSFKTEQVQQYDKLIEGVRENNRQLQTSLKESTSAQRSLETQMLTNRSSDSGKDFRIKDLEGSKRALEQENELLRKKLEGQCSSSTLQIKTQELSRHYEQMLKELREEKDKELSSMRSQLVKIRTEYTTERSSDSSLQLKISDLLSKLDQRETTIRRLEEDIRRLQQEKSSSSGSVTQTVITKRYQNQYPILGLLTDDYQATLSPVKESKTIVIKRTGEMTKKEYTSTP